jgi:branched-subunit amino acid aminotransferase/4-amino-4-deoxychorismate lyase
LDIISLNGEFLPLEDARVPATDGGLLVGEGVFETIRVESGQLLAFADHMARLARGLRVLGISWRLDPEELLARCHAVLDANGLADARLRITVTRGALRGHPIVETEGEATELITATRLDTRSEGKRDGGWRVVLLPWPRNERSPLAAIKCTSYAESLMARRQARAMGFDEALLLNTRGAVAEAAMANIFVVSGGRLATPRVEDGALPGTMRARVLRLAERLGIDAHAEPLSAEDVFSAEEVFLTNAIMQIMPVVGVGERLIGGGSPGVLTRHLFDAWRVEVEALIGESRRG